MNRRTAKLLRKFARTSNVRYRWVKRTWKKTPKADRRELREQIKADIQRNTKP